MLNGHRPIIVPPAVAQRRDDAFADDLSCELLAMASRWLGINTRGLSHDDARRVLRAEIARLTEIEKLQEAGI